jgi:hypothetical protein
MTPLALRAYPQIAISCHHVRLMQADVVAPRMLVKALFGVSLGSKSLPAHAEGRPILSGLIDHQPRVRVGLPITIARPGYSRPVWPFRPDA